MPCRDEAIGMLALAWYRLRQTSTDTRWVDIEKYVKADLGHQRRSDYDVNDELSPASLQSGCSQHDTGMRAA